MQIDLNHIKKLTHYCFTILKNEADSEDASSESLIKAFEKSKLQEEWGVILKFGKLTSLRKRQGYYVSKRSDSMSDQNVFLKAEKQTKVDDTRQDYSELWRALSHLSDIQNKALILDVLFPYHTQNAKAMMMTCKRENYNQHLARARKNMRLLLRNKQRHSGRKLDLPFFLHCVNIPKDRLPKCMWGQHLKGKGRPQNLKNHKKEMVNADRNKT